MNRFFLDKESGGNFENGLEFFAAGIIEGDYTNDGAGNPSGKDFAVVFITPWGEVERQWRGVDDVHIFMPDAADYELLKTSIGNIEKLTSG